MSVSQSNKRIGFILETVYLGSSLNLWHNVVERSSKENTALFVFPGGKIDSGYRNSIYSLVNPRNIDGLISWASSVGSNVSPQRIEEFHKNFSELPYVTIGNKIGKHSCVKFDAYTGMKELVQHFIRVHGAKKIAFIRGPENHTSSQERYHAFIDTLKEEKIYTKNAEKLISSPFGWYDGEKAAIEFWGRGLIPGRDFDAIVAASDMLAFYALEWFKTKGIKFPEDCIIGAFNNSHESRISVPPMSTVQVPFYEIGLESYEMLNRTFADPAIQEDKSFSAYPIFRESCGCNCFQILTKEIDTRKVVTNRKELEDEVFRIFRRTKDDTVFTEFVDNMLDKLFENEKDEFLKYVTKFLTAYFKHDADLANIFETMNVFKNSTCLPKEYINELSYLLNILVAQVQNQVSSEKFYNTNEINFTIGKLKNDLLSARSCDELIETLQSYLPKIGIRRFALSLYEDDDFSKYLGGFDDFGLQDYSDLHFSSKLLFPEEIESVFSRGAFVVLPLFTEEHSLGFAVLDYAEFSGSIYEDIRVFLSNVLQTVIFVEETERAKLLAEKAEFEKTEFFANVGSDLCDPLRDLSAKVSQMERNVNEGLVDPDIISEQLIFLNSQIEAQLSKTVTLVDLTRSQVDELPMDKRLFDIRSVLPVSVVDNITDEIPLLFGDPSRLKKVFDTIFEFAEGDISVSFDFHGIYLNFSGKKINWDDPKILLAEKIILLQYGTLRKASDAQIYFSWPNLAGLPPVKNISDKTRVFSLSSKFEPVFMNIQVERFSSNLPEDCGSVLVWYPDGSPIDEWIKVYGLRHYENVYRTPILCFGRTLIGHNFSEIIEQKIKAQKASPVLFVNAKHDRYGTWATDANTVSISSMEEFDGIIKEIDPSFIVFENIDEPSIIKIRQNKKTVLTPIIVIPDSVDDESQVELLCSYPKIILCNRGVAESEQFDARIHEILDGDEILPPHTGALVKRAIYYLNKNSGSQIVRWKLADSIHVSEDYLTRIFHKEIGLSLWEYLNRYRIFIATRMLLETNDSIYEIAENTGFQDQAYFCRVFKKIYGVPPGKIRSKN